MIEDRAVRLHPVLLREDRPDGDHLERAARPLQALRLQLPAQRIPFRVRCGVEMLVDPIEWRGCVRRRAIPVRPT